MTWVLLMRLLKFHVFASVLICVPAHLFMFVHCVLGEILCGCFFFDVRHTTIAGNALVCW